MVVMASYLCLVTLGVSPNPSLFAFLGRRCYSIGGLLPSLSVFRVVYCGQTVQDRPIVCVEVEQECGDEISIGTIFYLLGPP